MLVDLRIGQLLCSRLCHDLAGPIGAVNAGTELAQEEGAVDDECRALIASSGHRLARQLAFYRMAFGLQGGTEAGVALAEVRALAKGLFDLGSTTLDWPDAQEEAGVDLEVARPAGAARLLLCLLLVGADAIGRGGLLRVALSERGGGLHIALAARGRAAALPTDVRLALRSDTVPDRLTARTIHAYLAARLADDAGAQLRVDGDRLDQVRLDVCLPAATGAPAS
ncbi:MAG: histidine phosphotransferase [Rhodospirillales bacterium]|nr:MAG: histidine phosphotransferase [Rhodospirillales bacterium]